MVMMVTEEIDGEVVMAVMMVKGVQLMMVTDDNEGDNDMRGILTR